MLSKISGAPVATFRNFQLFVTEQKARKKGKDRIWLHIRQSEPKEWRIAATLSYVNALDVRFEKEADAS